MIYKWLDQYLNNLGVSKLGLGEIYSVQKRDSSSKPNLQMKHNTLSLLYLCLKIYSSPPQLQYNPNDTVVSAMYCGISREVQILISQINLSGHTQSFSFAP